MDWEEFVGSLSSQDRQEAEGIAQRYGQEVANRRVRYYPVNSLNELEAQLKKESERQITCVKGLYESIDEKKEPDGWQIENKGPQKDSFGTVLIQTDVIGPNGARGYFVRGFNAAQQRVELREAFLQHDGVTAKLPGWVSGTEVDLKPGKGIPTHLYFTLYQFKLLRVPAGHIRWWRRRLFQIRVYSGPYWRSGIIRSKRMRTIWNLETILHLHWLRQKYPNADLSDLIIHTASVRYAEDIAVQSGYRVERVSYVAGEEKEIQIDTIMREFEVDNSQRRDEHDGMLGRYSFNRETVMKQNFDIELTLVPEM